ncbi:SusD/RagB family nutrient-binding outer membrane lipoprotein, partial [Neokomagataea anthophila]
MTDINKNPLYPDEKALHQDGILLGSFLPALQQAVIPVSTGGTDAVNAYQESVNLTADAWCGYLS